MNFRGASSIESGASNKKAPLPALVLQSEADQRQLWITALGEDLGESFQLQSVSMKTRKSFFGKAKSEQDVTVVDVEGRSAVNKLCELFSQRQFEALDQEVDRLVQSESED